MKGFQGVVPLNPHWRLTAIGSGFQFAASVARLCKSTTALSTVLTEMMPLLDFVHSLEVFGNTFAQTCKQILSDSQGDSVLGINLKRG